MAIRVLLVLAIFVTLYGCGQMGAQNGHPNKKDAAAPAKNKQAMVEEKTYNTAEVDLQPANGSGTRGTATFSKAKGGGVKVVLKVTGLPRSGTMYLAHIHPGTCAEEEGGGAEHGPSHHEHGASEEIEYPLTPLEPNAQGDGTSTTVVHGVTLEGLLSGEPKHVNVHKPGPGEPPPVTCADLSEAK
jgi:predicted small lipoprotein YifL